MDDHRPTHKTDQQSPDEPGVEHRPSDDELRIEEPAVARWRAELEARRRAGVGDAEVVDLREAAEHRRLHSFRVRRLMWLALIVALIVLFIDLAYVGFGLRSRLLSASSSLNGGKEAINDADYVEANRDFRAALSDARDAATLEGNLGWRVVRALPGISGDARTVSVLTSVAELASLAGLDAIELYDRLGATKSGLAGALFEDGRVRLDSMRLATTSISELVTSLMEASTLANEQVEPRLEALDDALSRVRSDVAEALSSLRRAEALLAASPSLFGENSRREYLLVIGNPSRSRASGGVIEYYAVLSATDGKLKLGPVLPISTLEELGAGRPWDTVNRSVDFPVVARAILHRFEKQAGRQMDGVIGADSIAMQYMSKASGPVRGEGLDLAVGEDNAAKVLMHDVFQYFNRKSERDRFVSDIIKRIWFSVTKGVGNPSVLVDGLARATREQHMKVYVTDPRSEGAIDDLELSGDPTLLGPRVQSIAQNSLTTSNVDFFIRREAETRIALHDDGSASVETTLTIENRAPDGPPSSVLGRGSRPGTASLSIEMLLPKRAGDIALDGEEAEPAEVVRGRFLMVAHKSIPPGETRDVILSYELSPPDERNSTFELVLLPAPLAYPDRASVQVLAPEGFCVNSCEDPSPEQWDFKTTLTEALAIRARLVSADG